MSIPDETLARWAAWPRPGTPGPWVVIGEFNETGFGIERHEEPDPHAVTYPPGPYFPPFAEDAAFIAAAPEMREAIDALVAEVRRLREALVEGIDTAEEGWSYASDYFREKWDAEGQIQKMRDALRGDA